MSDHGVEMKVLHGDCLEVLPYVGLVHSVITDPPYGLKFMGKDWDKGVPGVPYWAAVFDQMLPGAYLAAFGGTRTFHRLACAIEDAGFEIRDCIMWVYGSGFPKSHNVSKALDKLEGASRTVVGENPTWRESKRDNQVFQAVNGGGAKYLTEPSSDLAKQWDGFGTALKPAWEPIIIARKPHKGTIAKNVIKHGTGVINIDACRVPTADKYSYPNGPGGKSHHYSSNKRSNEVRPNATQSHPLGGWPSNLIHDGSDEVVGEFPGVGSGSKSRFFYCAKVSKKERGDSKHPTMKPVSLMRYLCRLLTPPGGTVLDPFCGSGSTLVAAIQDGFDCIGIDSDQESVRTAKERLGMP